MKTTDDKLNKRQEQAAHTRENLLLAAKRLFSEQGFAATTVRSIHREVGLADGILYHYFPGGKAEIFSTLMREGGELVLKKLTSISEAVEGLPLEESLEKFYGTVDFLLADELPFFRLLLLESDQLGSEEKALLSRVIQTRVDWLAGFLERRWRAGEIRQMDFSIAAQQFISSSINVLVSKVLRIDLFGNHQSLAEQKRILNHTLSQWRME